MRIPLTSRQRVVFEYLRDYIAKNNVAPTFDEMATHFKRSLGTMHEIVAALEHRGWIRRYGDPRSPRNISIVEANDVAVSIANSLDHDAVTLDHLASQTTDPLARKLAHDAAVRLRGYARAMRT